MIDHSHDEKGSQEKKLLQWDIGINCSKRTFLQDFYFPKTYHMFK